MDMEDRMNEGFIKLTDSDYHTPMLIPVWRIIGVESTGNGTSIHLTDSATAVKVVEPVEHIFNMLPKPNLY